MPNPDIRHAEPADLEALTRLYNHFVETTTITFDIEPFTSKARKSWMAQFSRSGRYQLFVAEERGRIAGYASSTRHRAKPAYDASVEATIYVDPAFSRRGIGLSLYERLFSALADEDVHCIYAGVALPNPASIAFHQRFGFTEIGTFHEVGHKFGRYIDVMWLEKQL
jgi:phosphinothricin acetyltransferase